MARAKKTTEKDKKSASVKKKPTKKPTKKKTTKTKQKPPPKTLDDSVQRSKKFLGAGVDKDFANRFKKICGQGRKPKYTTAPQMEKVIVEYFEECIERDAPATMTGLALNLGISKSQMRRYEHKNKNFRETLKGAYHFVEHFYEELLVEGRGSTVGLIFALKQHDWTDKREIEMSGQVAIIATDEEDL